jgi:hypothetical protein
MSKRVLAVMIGVLAVGLTLGILGGIFLFDGGSDSDTAAGDASVLPIDCDEARAVVDGSIAAIDEINTSTEAQDTTFFVSILVEQRTMTFAMDAAPTCFTLQERAEAEGLIDGIRMLLSTPTAPASNNSTGATTGSDEIPVDTSGE